MLIVQLDFWWFQMLAGYPPFFDDNPFGIYEKILSGKIDWPRQVEPVVKDLIKKLLVQVCLQAQYYLHNLSSLLWKRFMQMFSNKLAGLAHCNVNLQCKNHPELKINVLVNIIWVPSRTGQRGWEPPRVGLRTSKGTGGSKTSTGRT